MGLGREQSPGKDEIGWWAPTGKLGSLMVRECESRLQRDGDLGQRDSGVRRGRGAARHSSRAYKEVGVCCQDLVGLLEVWNCGL